MKGDVRVTWFFAAFSLFAGSMLLLVSAPNLIQLIVGWEGVGLSSYLLIGHYWEQKENSSAGMKAFYVNKVADIGLIIGAFVLAIPVGSFRISDILERRGGGRRIHEDRRHRRGGAAVHRGDGQERPVPLPRVAPRRHGRPDSGLSPHARRHHGDRRGVPARAGCTRSTP